MASLDRAVRLVSKGCDKLAQVGIFAMLLLIVGNIVLRQFGKPIYGSYDYVCFLGALSVSLALANCALEKGHTQVEMLMERFPRRVQGVIDTVVGIVSFCLFVLITWQCISLAEDMRRSGEVSMTSHAAFHPYIYGVALGCALVALVVLLECSRALEKAVKG
jgi:TRAP-type C4-dicarboxylate transport system permease small subunit